MDEFIAWLWQVSYWHWWALGIFLLAIEVFVPSTFLIWPGMSAGVVGVIVAFVPDLDWRMQVLTFAVLAMASTVAWLTWLRRHPTQTDDPTLNVRAQRYVGRRVTLAETLVNGRGRIKLDDTWWLVESDDSGSIEEGVTIEITGADSTTLKIQAVGPQD